MKKAWLIAGGGALLCLIGALFDPEQFFRSWWLAWIFWGGVALGGVPLTALHFLTGGRWGESTRRPAEASMMTLPLIALLLVPAAFGLRDIFPWARPGFFAADAPHKAAYLTVSGFLLRAGVYFALVIILSRFLRLFSRAQGFRSTELDAGIRSGLGGISAVVWVLCMNFASTDWVMSLEPQWFSTIFAVIFMAGQFLSALALCVAVATSTAEISPSTLRDLGNLLLAFVIFWTYVGFSQFLIIWSGNLPREISWYIHRRNGGWPLVVGFLAVAQFATPFALLLSRSSKHHPRRLRAIALLVFGMGVVNVYWLMVPSWHPAGVRLHCLDFAALLTVGAAFSAEFLRALAKLPLEVPRA